MFGKRFLRLGAAVASFSALALCVGPAVALSDGHHHHRRHGRHVARHERLPVTFEDYYGTPDFAGGFFGTTGPHFTSDGHYDRSYRPGAYNAADVYAPKYLCGGPRDPELIKDYRPAPYPPPRQVEHLWPVKTPPIPDLAAECFPVF